MEEGIILHWKRTKKMINLTGTADVIKLCINEKTDIGSLILSSKEYIYGKIDGSLDGISLDIYKCTYIFR